MAVRPHDLLPRMSVVLLLSALAEQPWRGRRAQHMWDWLLKGTGKYGWPAYTILAGLILTVIEILLTHAIAGS
jgi:hypothetical protein